MTLVHIGRAVAAMALTLMVPPALAQGVYDNAIADHGQVVRDNAILRHNLEYARKRQNAERGTDPSDARKRAACAKRAEFSEQYGADHPKVRLLHALCARDGY